MFLSDIALLFLYLSASHLSSLLFEAVTLPPVVAYIVTGLLLRLAGLPAPYDIWEGLAVFSLMFVGFHAGLSLNINRSELRRFFVIASLNTSISLATVLVLLLPALSDLIRAAVVGIILANTATEGVIALSKYVKYGADLEAALRISVGDDLMVLLVATAILASLDKLNMLSLALSLTSIVLCSVVLTLILRRDLSTRMLNVITMVLLLAMVGLSVDNVGPLLGGYFVGMVLGLARSSRDPLLKIASHIETVADSLEMINNLVMMPLVFTYIGYTSTLTSVDPIITFAGLVGALAGKAIVVLVLSKARLITVFSKAEVLSLITVRGALESAIALTALKLGVLSNREFSSIIATALLTYPLAVSILTLSRAKTNHERNPTYIKSMR